MMAYSLFMLKIIFFAFYVVYFFLKQFYVHYLFVWHFGDLGYTWCPCSFGNVIIAQDCLCLKVLHFWNVDFSHWIYGFYSTVMKFYDDMLLQVGIVCIL